jgi:hypothetical protein
MRRSIAVPLLGVAGLLFGVVGLTGVASAKTAAPTVTLTEYCPVLEGQQFYGALVSLSGFPPNTTFNGSLQLDGTGGSGTFVTDASGNFAPTGLASPVPVALATATVTYSGGTVVQTLANPCQGLQAPTDKTQCKGRGFVGFGFKNQGTCVSYVVTGGKHT